MTTAKVWYPWVRATPPKRPIHPQTVSSVLTNTCPFIILLLFHGTGPAQLGHQADEHPPKVQGFAQYVAKTIMT